MLSSVAKIADKAFVIGFLLPALIFAVVVINLFPMPAQLAFLVPQKTSTNPFADLTFFALAVWVIATFLLRFNYLMYRILEGYMPPMSWLGWCKSYHRRRLARLQGQAENLRVAGDVLKATKLRMQWLSEYPSQPEWILPTMFGNAIRSFETYAYDLYRADTIVLWPRLATVVPKEFMAQIEDARSQANFLVSLCLVGWVIAGIAIGELLAPLIWPAHFHASPKSQQLGYVIFWALAASWIFYRWSIQALKPWGETIKTVSDCYLPALATQLGYVLPDRETERQAFWRTLVKRMVFRRPFPEKFNPISPAPQTVPPIPNPEETAAVKQIRSGLVSKLLRASLWILLFVVERRRRSRGD